MATLFGTFFILLQLWSGTVSAFTVNEKQNDLEQPANDGWTNVRLARLQTKIAVEQKADESVLPLAKTEIAHDAIDCGKEDSCPCNNPSKNECAANAICTNDHSQTLGYKCQCKNGFIDVFFTEPQVPGRLCVKTLPLDKVNENDRVADSKLLSAAVETKRPFTDSAGAFPPPPAFPAAVLRTLTQAQLRDVFDDLDQDRNGSISLRELKTYVREISEVKLSDTDMGRMIELADRNANTGVEWTEFIRLFVQQDFYRAVAKRKV